MRALGARKSTVFSSIVLEAAAISIIGTLVGYVIYGIILATAAIIVRAQTGVVLDVFQFQPVLVLTPIGMTIIGALSGIIPAYKAYSTDVATYIAPSS
jgi:putative ABC transport system permease protein